MKLKLERSLAFIDVESTGLDPGSARIVRITILKIAPGGDEQFRSELVNPAQPIPPGASAVHGLVDDDVADAPTFQSYARALASHLEDCDLAGFGIERFDLPLLETEFRRAGVDFSAEGRAVLDGMAIFHRLEPRNLASAYRKYVGGKPPEDREPEALIRAAAAVLEGELDSSPELPRQPAALAAWARGAPDNAIDSAGRFVWSAEGEALVNFGRYRGQRLGKIAEEVPDYLEWIGSNERFESATRVIALDAIRGRLPADDRDAPSGEQ